MSDVVQSDRCSVRSHFKVLIKECLHFKANIIQNPSYQAAMECQLMAKELAIMRYYEYKYIIFIFHILIKVTYISS